MLAGNNSILSRATEAKTKTETEGNREQIQIEVLGSYGTDGKINVANLKTNLQAKGYTVNGNSIPLTVTDNEQEFTITADGDVTNTPTTPAGAFGPQSDGSFIGLKSIGKNAEGEIDNYWKTATPVAINGKDGYKFTAGHFVHISNYDGWLWDETAGDWVEKTGADVYLCWNDDYGTITSEQNLIDYANNNSTTTHWDIFDASSGAWVSSDDQNGAQF